MKCSAVRTTPSDTIRDTSPCGSTWPRLQDSQVASAPKDYGSTLSWALLLVTSPPPNQPALLTGASSRRKQAHLIVHRLKGSFKKQVPLTSPFLRPLGCSGFDSLS